MNGGGLSFAIGYPAELPIVARREDIVAAIRAHPVVVLAGETGSGKSTQIPKMCLEAGLGRRRRIGCTQPRRVAALSIARRVAEELKVPYGREVGSKIRFNDETSRETRIKFMTDGILLAETQGDPELSEYDCIVIDEAHERSLNIDFLLGHLKLLLARRPDLKLVITSATIETGLFSRAFGDAPIIEVSGRLYPVEVLYRPFDHLAEEYGDFTYIDAAAHAVEEICASHPPGDILIFMPTEKDIRETRDLLQGRFGQIYDVIPLFGRLSAGEQSAVFSPGATPRIVVATNIAETSLTIPRIRYVVDAGLARISRYNPRTRTKRLPIEPVSQSSANQRKGRCGRVAEGVCLRLYTEEEFAARPVDTQPEIQRCNLAEVILRMKAFHLGDIRNFPFLNPPPPAAIATGFKLLHELGALDEDEGLTPLGWDLARLPVDPAIGRMILQAVRERTLAEVLVIAAGLSIQDPRERPAEAREAAEQAHRRFHVPESDFLTLLKIWNAFDAEFERLGTQNQMRRFCRSHFLSYQRLREWVDLYHQLEEAIESIDFTSLGETVMSLKSPGLPDPEAAIDVPRYTAIHRSILTGFLSQIAERTDKGFYRATGNRDVVIFPGSNLAEKSNAKEAGPKGANAPGQGLAGRAPRWIVAGELIETSRLFAHRVARIEPAWVAELGAHLCKFSHVEPHWNREQGRVLVLERVLLGGLQLLSRSVAYHRVNAKHATEIFLRAALVAQEWDSPQAFYAHNQRLREKIETWQTRLRQAGLLDLDEAFYRFYAARIQDVSSTHDLNRFIKEQGKGDGAFLMATEADILGEQSLEINAEAFPEKLTMGLSSVPLSYSYAPGEAHDGVTLRVPLTLLAQVRRGELEWAVPGWRETQIRELLKALPKTLRVPLMPLEPKVREIAGRLQPGNESLLEALSRHIRETWRVPVTPASWPAEALPMHLRPRLEVVDPKGTVVFETREFQGIPDKLRQMEKQVETDAWAAAALKWERHDVAQWSWPDLPPQIEIPTRSGIPLLAYPGLEGEGGSVSLRLFRQADEARRATRLGLPALAEKALEKEFAWLQKDLRSLNSVKEFYISLGPVEELVDSAVEFARSFLFQPAPSAKNNLGSGLSRAEFDQLIAQARQRLPGLVEQIVETTRTVLKLRHELLLRLHALESKYAPPKPAIPGRPAAPSAAAGLLATLRNRLQALVPRAFLRQVSPERLRHLPRFLKALQIRAERGLQNLAKDAERARQIEPYERALSQLLAQKAASAPERAAAIDLFRWMIEEWHVSLFAQELGTSIPVSPKRLDQHLAESGLTTPAVR